MNKLMNRINTARNNDEGFTLIELLIVIVVLGILGAIVVFGVGQFKASATASACQAGTDTVRVANAAYAATTGAPATSVATLVPAYLDKDPGVGCRNGLTA